jgi:amidase
MSPAEPGSAMIGRTGIDARGATIGALQDAMAAGTLSSADLTDFYLTRISSLDPQLHAVIAVSPAAAQEARASDQARASGAARGPLEGIPILIKDNIGTRELPATDGSPALLEAGCADAFLVGALRRAGAVIVGKANLSEWANFRSTSSSSGWSTLGGQAVNPWGEGRNPSGSSSGSAVAVAAGLAAAAVGTETDGSIISPSSVCGVVGVKPTLGLVSRSGIVPVSLAQDTAGPMTSCVADAAMLLAALAGADPADQATARAPSQRTDYTARMDPDALAGARLGIWRDGSKTASQATAAELDAAVALLRSLGAEVIDPVQLPGADDISEPEHLAMVHEFKQDLNAYLAPLPGDHPASLTELIPYNSQNANRVLVHFGQEIFEHAEATSGDPTDAGYLAARGEAGRLARGSLDDALTRHRLDAVVALPGSPAWLTDHVLGDHYAFGTTSPAAVAGYPSICVPVGLVRGLPVAVSFVGPPWSEPALIGFAYAFEQARPALQAPPARR